MMTRCDFRWLLIPLLTFSLQTARADAPVGELEYVFGSFTPIVDLSGTYSINAPADGPDGLPVDLVLSAVEIEQDGRGRLRGTDQAVFGTLGSDLFAGFPSISGQVSTARGVTRVRLTVRVTGNAAMIAGRPVDSFSITTTITGEVDPDSGAIFGRARTQAKFRGSVGKLSGRDNDFVLELPDNVDGTWTLKLNVAPGIEPLFGTAQITLSNDRMLNFNLSGNYRRGNDTSNLRLKGIDESAGSNLSLTLNGFLDILRLNGRVLGQKVE